MLTSIRKPAALLSMLALLHSTACYAYRPVVGGASPHVGDRVRLGLTPPGTTELARYLGPRVVSADGDLTARDDTAYVVAVDFVQTADGIRQPWTGEGVVSIPTAFVSNVQQRTFLKRQTIIVSAVTVVLLIVTAAAAINSGILGADGGAGGPPNP